jgi:tetratricopeptide (TPR) repeat protein
MKNLLPALLLFMLAFILYGNTLSNRFALDDVIVITGNQFTQKGIKGIGDIMTHDAFVGAYGEALNLSGGRYRPLSIVMFALEYQVWGINPGVNHFFNVLFFALTGALIFLVLRKLLPSQNQWLPFVAALLFIIHPIHTEVVANIKSRDEILVLFFLMCSLLFFLNKGVVSYVASVILFFLALLSKENAITYLAILPLACYFFTDTGFKKIMLRCIPLFCVAVVYLVMRAQFAGMLGDRITSDIMDAPYLHSSVFEKTATIMMILGRYLLLLIFPHPLSYDYSYNQVPNVSWSSPWALLSLGIHAALLYYAVKNTRTKSTAAFGIYYYFITISIVSNLVFNIGTPMAERFLYLSSLGFCLVIASLMQQYLKPGIKAKDKIRWRAAWVLPLAVVCLAGSAKTINRNKDWENNYTLYKTDIKTVPNSARARLYYGIELIGQYDKTGNPEFINQSIEEIRKSCEINPDFSYAFHNLGVAYQRVNRHDEAIACYKRVLELEGDNVQALYGLGLAYGKGKNMLDTATVIFNNLIYDRKLSRPEYYVNLGLCYAMRGRFTEAKNVFSEGISKNPRDGDLYFNLAITYGNMGSKDSADLYFKQAFALKPELQNSMQPPAR